MTRMTLDEAITEATLLAAHDHVKAWPKKLEALKLGIEALKRFRSLREAGQYVGMPKLRGEK